MRRYSEFEIASSLNRLRRGEPLAAIAEMQDIPERVIRLWRSRFFNLSAAEIREARVLEAENRRLRVRIRRLRREVMDATGLRGMDDTIGAKSVAGVRAAMGVEGVSGVRGRQAYE